LKTNRAVAGLLVAGILAGCGASAQPPPPAAPASGAVNAPRLPFRWLIPTAGPQPSIAAENRARGTGAWRLPGPSRDVGGLAHGAVIGYVAAPTVSPGQVQRIYVSAPGSRHVRISVFRIGWYGGTGGREVLRSDSLRVVHQPPCRHSFRTGLTECRWHPTLSFPIPPALPTGVYIAKLSTSRGQRDCLFVVRSTRPQPLLAQLPTSTYEAYNAWGGDSLYPGGAYRVGVTRSTQGVEVSYQRPYDSDTGAGQFFARDVAMVRFLERYRYPVSYTASESVDLDPGQLARHRAVIDFGHSEYWSQRQLSAFARARNSGASLLFLSSDTMAWRVRYEARGNTIVAYKEFAKRDPDRTTPTGRFPDGGGSLMGSAYEGCITPRLSMTGPPRYLYYPWMAAPGLRPAWLFRHTGINARTTIPGIVGYELDMRTRATPRGAQTVGAGVASCMSTEAGEPAPGLGQDLAQTTLYTTHRGALVFSSGTLGWELALEPVPSASPNAPVAPDPRVVAMTRNLLARVLRRPGA
jgi:hypothetical protein